jgi:hypothetical protein
LHSVGIGVSLGMNSSFQTDNTKVINNATDYKTKAIVNRINNKRMEDSY